MSPSSSSRKSPIQSSSCTVIPPVVARSPYSVLAEVNWYSLASKSDVPGEGTGNVRSTDFILGLLWARLSSGRSAANMNVSNLLVLMALVGIHEYESCWENILIVDIFDFKKRAFHEFIIGLERLASGEAEALKLLDM